MERGLEFPHLVRGFIGQSAPIDAEFPYLRICSTPPPPLPLPLSPTAPPLPPPIVLPALWLLSSREVLREFFLRAMWIHWRVATADGGWIYWLLLGGRITVRPDNAVPAGKIILAESKKRLLGLLLLRIS